MSYGVTVSREAPEQYRPTDRITLCGPTSSNPNFDKTHFVNQKYLDDTERIVLSDNFNLSNRKLFAIDKIIGEVLRAVQAASMVPIAVARATSAEIAPSNMDYYSTLSPEVLIATIRQCINDVLVRVCYIFENNLNESNAKKLKGEIDFFKGIKDARTDAKLPSFALQRVVKRDDVDEQAIKNGQLISVAAKGLILAIAPEYLDTINRMVTVFASVIYNRAMLSRSSFQRDVGAPYLIPPYTYVCLGTCVATSRNMNNLPTGSVFVDSFDNAQNLVNHGADPNAVFVSCPNEGRTYDYPIEKTGIAPGDTIAYSTLNPHDLIRMIKNNTGNFAIGLAFGKLEKDRRGQEQILSGQP